MEAKKWLGIIAQAKCDSRREGRFLDFGKGGWWRVVYQFQAISLEWYQKFTHIGPGDVWIEFYITHFLK